MKKENAPNQEPKLSGGGQFEEDKIPPQTFYPVYYADDLSSLDYSYDEDDQGHHEDLNSLPLGGSDMIAYNQDGSIVNFTNFDWSQAQVYEDDYSNDTNYTDSLYDHSFNSASRNGALAFFALCFLVGLIGNALVVYTVARYVTMRRVTYLYLLNLSVAGLVYLLVCLPTLTVSYALVDWPFGLHFCKLANYIMSVSMSVSVLTIMATGLERYIAVMYPVKYKYISTNKKAICVICFTWVLSLLVMVPRLFLFDQMLTLQYTGIARLCTRVASHDYLRLDTTLNFVFMYLLPIVVLSFCHLRIGFKLWKSSRPGAANLAVRDRCRIAKIVFAITIVFVLGWLPLHLYHLVEDFDKGRIPFGEVVDRGTIVLIFSFGANALNPVFYFVISSSFRKHFKKAFRCWNSSPVASSETGETTFLTRGQGQQEYRRPPPVLLPRPASLLPDLPTPANVKAVSFREFQIMSRNNMSCARPLLAEELDSPVNLAESSTDVRPQTSPLTIEKVSHIEVTNSPKLESQTVISRMVPGSSSTKQHLECLDVKEISTKPLKCVSVISDDVARSQQGVLTTSPSSDTLESIESHDLTDLPNGLSSCPKRILPGNSSLSSYQHRYHVIDRDQNLPQRQNGLCNRQAKTRTLAEFANRFVFEDISDTMCDHSFQLQNGKSTNRLFPNCKNSSTNVEAGESILSMPSETIRVPITKSLKCVQESDNKTILSVQEKRQPSSRKSASKIGPSSGNAFINLKHNHQSVTHPCSSGDLNQLPSSREKKKTFVTPLNHLPSVD